MDNELGALGIIFTEFYYWITIVLMFLIHVGFCMYEVGASRRKNHMHTLMKNTMVIPLITVGFFLFGWWIYFAFPTGPFITDTAGTPGSSALVDAPQAVPWSELMGVHMGGTQPGGLDADTTGAWARINGVFFGAFLLFSWTTGSIISGSLIERVRSSAFWLIATFVGSVAWILDASWGWHPDGWMVQLLGYHDAYASGVVHAIAGGAALAVLIHLGPRIGKFRADGTPRTIVAHNPWLITVGLFLIYTGFWGFYVACNIPMLELQEGEGVMFTATTIYLTPTTLSGITLNFLMSLAGGLLSTYVVSRGDAFWTYSGGLCGIIGASAGNDLYHPLQAMLIGAVVPVICYKLHHWVERRFKIDDAVGAVAVHGYGGFLGVVIAGFMLWGYPASQIYDVHITPWGNFAGAVIMFFGLGFLPAFILAGILKAIGMLRIPREIELVGLDLSEHAARYVEEEEMEAAEIDEARRAGWIR